MPIMKTGEDPHGAGVILERIRAKEASIIELGEDTDVELFEILASHILVPSPDETAVEQAMDDIKNLVGERAEY